MVAITLGLGINSCPRPSSGTAPAVPSFLANLPGSPYGVWSAEHSTVTTSGGRVTSVSNLVTANNDPLSPVSGVQGPEELTDALGRKFWRFNRSQALELRELLASYRDITVLLVGRDLTFSNASETGTLSYVSFGANGATGGATTPSSTGARGALGYTSNATTSNVLQYMDRASATVDRWALQVGTQMAVMGVASAASRTSWYVSGLTGTTGGTPSGIAATVASNTALTDTIRGMTLGGANWSGAPVAGNWAAFDCYALVIYASGLSNADLVTAGAALRTPYSIPVIANQLVIEGDSIQRTKGADVPDRSGALGALLGAPGGASALPSDWRITVVATTGSTLQALHNRANSNVGQNGWVVQPAPPGGRKVVTVSCFYNEINTVGTNRTAAASYSTGLLTNTGCGLVEYLSSIVNTSAAEISPLFQGWEVLVHTPIATNFNATNAQRIQDYRTLVQAAQFLTDCRASTGQTYDGKLKVYDLHSWQVSGATIFDEATDADNTTYYTDKIHLNSAAVVHQAAALRAGLAAQFGI